MPRTRNKQLPPTVSADSGQPHLAPLSGANLIDDAGPSSHEPVAHSVQRLQIELILGLDGHETHVLPLHRLGNRFCIAVVILVGFNERSHKLRRNQAYLVPLFAQRSPQKVRAHAGFHADQ